MEFIEKIWTYFYKWYIIIYPRKEKERSDKVNSNLQERYKIKQTAVEKSFARQMGLKMNKEYENWADNIGTELIELFLEKYKGAIIEMPRIREKSPKSLLGKIKNLQIERLSKLYAVDGINKEEREELYSLIKERILENKELDENAILNEVRKLLEEEIAQIDIKKLEETLMVEGISRSTKTALLRILVSKIEKSSLKNKDEILQKFDERYGEKAAKSGILEEDIIKYNSIRDLQNNERKLGRLRDEKQFLKANDLRGMKIIVVDIPDNFKTENQKIKEILENRKNAKTSEEKIMYTHSAIVEVGKEFYSELANNEELLKKLNLEVIPDSNKHKKKINGYEAEHIKFMSKKEPEYTLELQFKSEYVENISRGEGAASHENRPGKSRILPQANTDAELIEKLKFSVPKYKTFRIEKNGIKVKEYTMLENVMGFYQGKLEVDSEEYNKLITVLSNKEKEQKVI